MKLFSYRSARSGSLVAGICIALLAETLGIHLWVSRHNQVVAWVVTLLSLSTLTWIAGDYIAMGKGAVAVDDEAIVIRIGKRIGARVPRRDIERAVRPTWQEIPATGSVEGADFMNLTKPATPNVLLTVREPAAIRVFGFARRARRLGLHLDDPDGFLTALAQR